MYLDVADETMAYYTDVDDPCNYVKYTPKLFNKWVDWARIYRPKENDSLRPFGDKIGPDWMRTEFDGLESFYQHYIDITQNL